MEDGLMGFVLLAITVISVIAKSQKKKRQAQQKKQAAPVRQTGAQWSELEQALRSAFEEEKTAQPLTHEGVHPCDIHSSAPAVAAQPRVGVSTRPDKVLGSMQEDSHEGLHPCDEHEGEPAAAMPPMLPAAEEKPGITLEWTGDSLVKSFIMQEVLTRPCQRRRA